MPKQRRKWKVSGPTSYGEAKVARGNLEYRSDMAEAAQDQKHADKLLSQEKYLKMIREANKINRLTPEMDKLKEQRKFKQRKEIL